MYKIKMNGLYFCESTTYGNGFFIKDKEQATECIDQKDAMAYLDEIDLAYDKVTLVMVTPDGNEIPYKWHNGFWYNIEVHTVCDKCGEITLRTNINHIQSVNGYERLCYGCYSDLDEADYEDCEEE